MYAIRLEWEDKLISLLFIFSKSIFHFSEFQKIKFYEFLKKDGIGGSKVIFKCN
jgi:hypothetical protein